LTFLASPQRLAPAAERAEYQQHQNHPHDPGYRQFLSRLTQPLIPKLRPGAVGLDYGSGPGPTLSVMLAEHGFSMRLYDPYFAPDTAALSSNYDFITCTETIEHFYHPDAEFARLNQLLRPGGWLGLMTEIQTDDDRFASWWYVRDPTHVCFYKQETIHWLAQRYGWQLDMPRRNVFLLQKCDD
jgi:2-polyprenyl-3-methyl-5-hydroxy-6-metoxy-1,4-benzoquinol methylase